MNTLVALFQEIAKRNSDKAAVVTRSATITYSQLEEEAGKAAAWLRERGIKKGERILLEATASADFVIAFLAVQRIGGVTIPIMRACKAETFQYISQLVDGKMYLSGSIAKGVDLGIAHYAYKTMREEGAAYEVIPCEKMEPDDLLEMIFTTGSTGKPKGTMHTVKAIAANMENTRDGIGMQPTDVVLIPLPLNHSFALRVLRSALINGETVVLQNSAVSFRETARNIREHHCNAWIGVNTAMETMLATENEEDVLDLFKGLRYMEFSAGALSMKLRRKLLEKLPDVQIHNTWGSSETGGCLFLELNAHRDKITSMGKPLASIQVGLLGEDGNWISERGSKHPGKLALKGDMQTVGYYGNEQLTGQLLKDDWVIMSDLVWQDEDGFLYMLGRADDLINCGGEKISPIEIEEVILKEDTIRECAVIGVPDQKGQMGEVPALFYVERAPEKEVDVEKLKEKIGRLLAIYKVPQYMIKKSILPKNSMGKIDRKALKKEWETVYSIENEVVKNILTRRSIRKFQDKSLEVHEIQTLLTCGKAAPSGKNLKTRRFTIIQSREEIERLKGITAEVAKRNLLPLNGFNNPPCLILISNDKRNQDGIQDAAVSAENMMLAAHSMGLGSVWLNILMNLCDDEAIRTVLNEYQIPANHIVWAMLAIGWPDEPGVIPEERGNEVYFI